MQFGKKVTLAASLAIVTVGSFASAAAITAGNLVVARVGDGSAAISTTATALFLDEYTLTGSLVQSIAVPSTGPSALTLVGNSTTEGLMSISQDKTSLVFAGYRKDAGGTQPSSDAGSVTNRVIGRVNIAGVVDTSVALTDPTSNIRSATTVDGSTYYIATAGSVRYVATPGPAATTVVIDARNSRQVQLLDNILYASNGSTAITPKVQSYGTLPTGLTTPTPVVTLALGDAVNGIYFADLSTSVAGVDTLYCLSTVESLLRKYSFDGTNWVANGSIPSGGTQDLTGTYNSLGVTLFATTNSTIRTFTDVSGYNSTITAGTLTTIATAGTNMQFRGMGILPEPATMSGLAGLAMLVISRRRKA